MEAKIQSLLLSKKDAKIHVATLLHMVGPEVLEV